MVKQIAALQEKMDPIVRRLWSEKILFGEWQYAHKANDMLAEALVHSSALSENKEAGGFNRSLQQLV